MAEMQAYATLELALRLKVQMPNRQKPPGLKRLMDQAIEDGLLADDRIEHARRLRKRRDEMDQVLRSIPGASPTQMPQHPDPAAYCRVLMKTFPGLRNRYAHGNPDLTGHTWLVFSVCRDLISQLFHTPAK
jgi:hypothetical protein